MTEEKTITLKKSDLWKYSTFLLVIVIVILGIVMFTGGSTTGGAIIPSTGNDGGTGSVTIDESIIADYPSIGDPNAPVTIIDFSDYLCSYCGRHHSQTYPLIKQDYIDKGLVRYVFMDFISVGNPSIHEAAKCVLELGGEEAYLEFSDEVYANQQIVYSDTESTLTGYATSLGISESEFTSCWSSGKYASEVTRSSAYGRSLGISGTPAFFVNGELISGAQPFSVFQQAIESQL